jgi:hypothetical protein
MEPYWCTEKNDIRNLMKIPIALTPCRKSECNRWRGGECIQIRKAGKPEKPQVFSRQDRIIVLQNVDNFSLGMRFF